MIGNGIAINQVARASEAGAGDFKRSSRAVARPPARAGWWLNLLCFTLLGYTLLGRTWAYLGVAPVYIGEAVLLSGLLMLIVTGSWRGLLRIPSLWPLLALGTWGAIRVLPEISVYGMDALRDAVIWGYGLFAVLVFASLRARPSQLEGLLSYYRHFASFYLFCVPVIWFSSRFIELPRCPWVDMPLLAVKGGDLLVHISGILAFSVGLGSPLGTFWLLLLAVDVVMVGTFDRGGFLSFLQVFALCFCLRPRNRSLRWLFGLGMAVLVFLAITDIQIKMPGREREISFRQVLANVSSAFSDERLGDLDDTKQWRLDWWNDIIGYTVNGRYFWTGKGFGINLADDDNYQVDEDHGVRSPHSGHLTMLARGGVPGFLLWVAVQLSWASGMASGYFRSRRLGQRRWNGVFLFLFAYWLSCMFNGAFDVFFEGPMGGIWLWTIYGTGLAAMWLQRHKPEVLQDDSPPKLPRRRQDVQLNWRT